MALAADRLPLLCPSALTGLARFISCGLEARLKTLKHAEFRSPTASIQFDTRLNQTLYVITLNVDLPSLTSYYFSASQDDILVNIHHVAVLVKTFHNYGFIGEVCAGEGEDKAWAESDLEKISSLTVKNIYRRWDRIQDIKESMAELRGPMVDGHNTSLVCFSEMDGYSEQVKLDLVCLRDPVYQKDKEVMRKIRSSKCLKHLDMRQPRRNSGGASNWRSLLISFIHSLFVLFSLLEID